MNTLCGCWSGWEAVCYWRNALVPVRLGNRAAEELWWSKIWRDGSVYGNKLHPSLTYRLLYTGGHRAFRRTLTYEYKHTPKKRVIGKKKKVWKLSNLFSTSYRQVRKAITGVTRHSGLIGVCLSLASLFWGSGWMGFVAVVLPEAWLGWFTGSVGTCAGDTPRAAWWGPKQPHCCCLHIWSLDWVALPNASLPPFFPLHIHIHPSIPVPQLLSPPPPFPPSSTVCVAAEAQLKFKISSHFFLSPTHFPSPLSLSSASPSYPASNTTDEGQTSQKKKNKNESTSWNACGRHHRGDCYSSLWKPEPKCSQGDSPVIFQGIEDQAPELQSGHINILPLTYIINSSAINMLLHVVTHTT